MQTKAGKLTEALLTVLMAVLIVFTMQGTRSEAAVNISYETGWVYGTDDGVWCSPIDSKADISKIYSIRVTIAGDDIMNGPLDLWSESTDEAHIWGNDYEWNTGIDIKLTDAASEGQYVFTYSTGKALFSKTDTYTNVHIGQYWGSDITIIDIELLGKDGTVLDRYKTTALSETEAEIYIGEQLQLQLFNAPGTVKWSSSNAKVASVKNGLVTAVKKGSAVISAKSGGKTYKCKIRVLKQGFSVASLSMAAGSCYGLKVGGTEVIKYSSSSSKVASVNSKTGAVTAKKAGSATIKAKCENGKTYSCKIYVFDQDRMIDLTWDSSKSTEDMLAAVEKSVNKVLSSDYSVFKLDFYNGRHGDCASPFNFDCNLIDLTQGAIDITVEFKSAEGTTLSLRTDWEEEFDLNGRTDVWVDGSSKKQTYTFSLSADLSDQIRQIGRLWIYGSDYNLYSVTVSGRSADSYGGITYTETSPAAVNGQLAVDGLNIVNENGEPYRLLGAAFGWDQLELQYANSITYAYARDEWGMNSVRIGETTEVEGGYGADDSSKDEIIYFIEEMIDSCIEAGMYAVIDWHSFQNPFDSADDAAEYFEIISSKYAGCPNIIYEICNEPCPNDLTPEEDDTWEIIKAYADRIIPIIRANSPDAVIVCGGPSWSNDVLVRANDPLTYDNIIYTDHIYACTHNDYEDVTEALELGLPILITEMNICEASGDGELDPESGEKWMEILDKYNVGYFMWGIGCAGGSESMKKGAYARCGWTEDDYTECGLFFYHHMRQDAGLE